MNAKNEEANGASIDDCLSQFVVVLCDTAEGKSGCFFHRWIEFFEAVYKGIKSAGVDDGLSKVGGVFGNRSQNVGGGFFVEALKKFKLLS